MIDASDFFVAGGTLRSQSPSYVLRPADEQLYRSLLAGEFCYTLTARQMGKSSLMVRTAARLREEGIRSVIIDLTSLGGNDLSIDEWYLGLLSRIRSGLQLPVDVQEWWQAQALSAPQRFTSFLQAHLLAGDAAADQREPIVILIDEIDSTLNLSFRDDFFAAVRALYNARASDPRLNRLTFAFFGVATPTDLIQNRERTPFNIGQRIDLHEFSYADAQPLRDGLNALFPSQGEAILRRIFHWSNGHPYLTQKLCLAIASQPERQWTESTIDSEIDSDIDSAIDALVAQSFFSEEGRKDSNLTFIQDRILSSPPPERRALLRLYGQVHRGNPMRDDDRSLIQNRLELYGLLTVKQQMLAVSNEIYRHVFDGEWVAANTPADSSRRVAFVSLLSAILLVAVAVLFLYQGSQQDCQTFVDQFTQNKDSEVRIGALSSLFSQNGHCDEQALRLFYEKTDTVEQESLFLYLSNPQSVRNNLYTVIDKLSRALDWDTSGQLHDQHLMEAMLDVLKRAQVVDSDQLVQVLTYWLRGRKQDRDKNPSGAVAEYTLAIYRDNDQPVIHYDRAKVYIAQANYPGALADLDEVVRIAQLTLPTPTPSPSSSPTASEDIGVTQPNSPLGVATPGVIPITTQVAVPTATNRRNI